MLLTPTASKLYKVYALSESAVTLEFGKEINLETAEEIAQFKSLIEQHPFPGLQSLVPAYTTLTIFYNLPMLMSSNALKGLDGYEKVLYYLSELEYKKTDVEVVEGNSTTRIIPVCYESRFAPDLQFVSKHTGLSESEIIKLHCSAAYRVYMIGFMPGFAYLGGMPKELTTPRKQTPSRSVAAGSVGIAGIQTGIYPMMSPGGWQIIGCTPLQLFNANQSAPSLLRAGDTVKFSPIAIDEFNRLKQE